MASSTRSSALRGLGRDSGPSVVVITVTASLEDSADAPFTGLSYRDFINLVQSRDHLWLVPGH